jgi:predicted nucleotidyltransferase
MGKKYQRLVSKYVENVSDSGIKIKALYLFGSRIKGTAKRDSDLDVCIVSDDFGDDMVENRVRLMGLVDYESEILIEPHPMKGEDFEDKYNPLAVEIKRTGIRVL